jgi:hypothetical protein
MKRTEVKIHDAFGHHWRPAEIIGSDDGDLVVEYMSLKGERLETTVTEFEVRHVDAVLTDELLHGAAQAAVDHLRQNAPEINPSDVELAGNWVLSSLRLFFDYPSR